MKNKRMQEIEAKEGRPIEDVLRSLYQKHAGNPRIQQAVADELGISQPTLSQWLLRLRLVQKITLVSEEQLKGGDAAEPCTSA